MKFPASRTRKAVEDLRDLMAYKASGAALGAVAEQLSLARGEIDRLRKAVAELEPVKVDVDRRLAAAVVKTLFDPFVVPDEVADLWARAARSCAVYQQVPLYMYGAGDGAIQIQIKPGGRMQIELVDTNGRRYWRGEWHRARPPASGREGEAGGRG